jgi:hypothetical protein
MVVRTAERERRMVVNCMFAVGGLKCGVVVWVFDVMRRFGLEIEGGERGIIDFWR